MSTDKDQMIGIVWLQVLQECAEIIEQKDEQKFRHV